LAALDNRLKSLESAGGSSGPANERWQSLAARLDDAESAIARLGAGPAAEGQAGADPEAIARLESALQELASESAARQRQIDELSGRLDEMAKRLTVSVDAARERLGESERAARLAAARSLQTAYERGEPLDPWLDAVEGFTGPDPALVELRKASPVATLAQLQRGLAETGDRILAEGAPAQSGWTARLWANARSLVRVRPDGPVAGETPEAILTRVEAALADNRLDLALSEWRQLPEKARQAGQQWQTELEARIAADERLAELLGRLASPAAGG
jgi:hypothetical protein